MYLYLIVPFLLTTFQTTTQAIQINPSKTDHTYDGHGALSAGASSRLLYDYPDQQRDEILDYLFKPNFGAALDLIKVEIGGDSQSTDGTEPSHAHYRDDLNCHRGYEWWLLEEAKKRNPDIVTYVLSWAVPKWVGNDTYYSDDNINYHMSWLKCARDEHSELNIDYIGAWNERSWGNPDWIIQFRQAMDDEGFNNTKIIIPDGGFDPQILIDIDNDATGEFKNALQGGGIGLHYPCNQPHPEIQSKYGLKYWSSEDYSTEANWDGAGCWGRLLNQNMVRMNMTSTISWSLIWSVYNNFPYFGNGLMYAFEPWSGHYEVNAAIWTGAQTTQFITPGWRYVGGEGRGSLKNGGTYVSLVSRDAADKDVRNTAAADIDVTIVIEKLHGKCLRCPGQNTTSEKVTFVLDKSLRNIRGQSTLAVWQTNETNQFVQLTDASIDSITGAVSITIDPDSIVTLTSLRGQQKGTFPTAIPPSSPFPIPYSDDFEKRALASVPFYFSDNGGSFEIASDTNEDDEKTNQFLRQMVIAPPLNNAWIKDVSAISVIGDVSLQWSDAIQIQVKIRLVQDPKNVVQDGAMYAGVCLHVYGNGYDQKQNVGTCILIERKDDKLMWVLSEYRKNVQSGMLPVVNAMESGVGFWHTLTLTSNGDRVKGTVNGTIVFDALRTNTSVIGRAAVVSGWHVADFDDFKVKKSDISRIKVE